MAQQNNDTSSGARQAAVATGKAAKFGIKAAKEATKIAAEAATGTLEIKVVVIAAIFVVCIILLMVLPAGTSTSQFEDTYYLSVENSGEVNEPSDDEKEAAIYDENRAKDKTAKLLEIVTEIKQEDLEQNVKNTWLKSDCSKHGWDFNLTYSHAMMDYEVTTVETEINEDEESYTQVQETYDISDVSAKAKKKFTLYETSAESAASKDIYEDEDTYLDRHLYRRTCGETTDYLVRMGSFFGGSGNRYKVTFSDGSEMTVLKVESFDKEETVSSNGIVRKGGGLIEFVVDANNAGTKERLETIISGRKIEKIERLGSQFSSQASQMSSSDSRLLAAYSIYLDNMELEAVNVGLRKRIVNQRGDTVDTKWIWNDNTIDNEESLKDALKKFLNTTNPDTGNKYSFYSLDYKRDADGNIIVNSVTTTRTVTNSKGEKVTKKTTKHYATPVIVELDLNSLVETIFNLNPDDPYVNSGTPYIEAGTDDESETITRTNEKSATIREAINTIAENTEALLYNTSGEGQIILSNLGGELECPTPGYTSTASITSHYGYRNTGIAGASTNHKGIDIGVPMGTKIVAAEDGTIGYAGWIGAGGNWVSITHKGGLKTNYGHLSKIIVKVGQSVKKGEIIAYSGSTGVSSGPHLHFEVNVNGQDTNPEPYIYG